MEQLKELRERCAFPEHVTPVALFTTRSPREKEGDRVSERELQSEVLGASSEASGVYSGTVGAVCETLGIHGGVSAEAIEPMAAPALVAQQLPPLSKFFVGKETVKRRHLTSCSSWRWLLLPVSAMSKQS